jgi:hypothetical protein
MIFISLAREGSTVLLLQESFLLWPPTHVSDQVSFYVPSPAIGFVGPILHEQNHKKGFTLPGTYFCPCWSQPPVLPPHETSKANAI